MQIDELAGNTVKITLDPSDMDGYRIKCEDISGDSRTSELALSRLISCLSEDHDLGLCGERLLVEAFPKSDGGCTLYISCLKGTPSGKNTSAAYGGHLRGRALRSRKALQGTQGCRRPCILIRRP